MKKILTVNRKEGFIDLDDINTVKDLIVCVHSTRNGVGALTRTNPEDGKYIWKITNGNGLFGFHDTIREAIDIAKTKGYEVRLLTSEDFDV